MNLICNLTVFSHYSQLLLKFVRNAKDILNKVLLHFTFVWLKRDRSLFFCNVCYEKKREKRRICRIGEIDLNQTVVSMWNLFYLVFLYLDVSVQMLLFQFILGKRKEKEMPKWWISSDWLTVSFFWFPDLFSRKILFKLRRDFVGWGIVAF